ncbi:membrane protease subunit, stomatin/prohibitin [Desulfosporosinus acidiphilus SJ4]|uniref:Membrane protease subunit, stomatin/prohibitin n=1 Tax=Desulfosporosinus acidiphilus (strain DSM 22704 / JCM 16185 / SJ4) TaxID=646529 RepID=I4D831_DESAJ|nr:SPFH domain-containing protein [Desulfosporosinus acidiphilus]AFM41955.1 membrane protease subunit, stomatin/prohibitin [Desulfosporosinus acidiphilus SJ4]
MIDSNFTNVIPLRISSISIVLFIIIFTLGSVIGFFLHIPVIIIASFLVALLVSASVKVSRQWEKAIILRLGKFQRLSGPGLFFIIPIIDSVSSWVDQRIITTSFNAEQTLTKDTVPVDVDAVLFWMVWDAEKAALEVEKYKDAVTWAAQTALRDVIGRTQLAEMLAGRENIDEELRRIIDRRTEPWGVSVQSVEIRDVIIPKSLQDAMSREAQAERERKARVILGTAETEIATKFAEAAKAYENNPVALHLRAMNILYEGLKEKGALVVVPSTAVETMGLGTITGLASMAKYPPE